MNDGRLFNIPLSILFFHRLKDVRTIKHDRSLIFITTRMDGRQK